MSRNDLEKLEGGAYRRKTKRRLGLFIDGVGLDRATRRVSKKVDLSRLVSGLCSGLKPEIARYYTLIPNEDDARQFAFLDAVERSGLKVIVKRLPPIGVKRQVSMDVQMASDLIVFGYGHFDDNNPDIVGGVAKTANGNGIAHTTSHTGSNHENGAVADTTAIKRIAVIVCPSRELSYAIDMSHKLGVETSLADFGLYGTTDGWQGVDRWIDLSTSETIWRD